MIKVSQALVFHFTTPFSVCFREAHLEPGRTSTMDLFFVKIPNCVKLLTIFGRKAPSQMFHWVENRVLAKGFKY